MTLHDLLRDREANPCPRISFTLMKPLENDEDAFAVTRIDADAVVPNRKNPLCPPRLCRGMNHWRGRAPELDGVSNQVLQQLLHLDPVGERGRQRIISDDRTRLLDRQAQVIEGAGQGS